jgi:hypothetical protein
MEENNCKYNTLVIIGNGFDLAHGYKTKYTDFVASVEENYFNNYISLLKLNRVNSDDWSDFENRVYEMAENFRQGELELSPNTDFADEFNSIFLLSFLFHPLPFVLFLPLGLLPFQACHLIAYQYQ